MARSPKTSKYGKDLVSQEQILDSPFLFFSWATVASSLRHLELNGIKMLVFIYTSQDDLSELSLSTASAIDTIAQANRDALRLR